VGEGGERGSRARSPVLRRPGSGFSFCIQHSLWLGRSGTQGGESQKVVELKSSNRVLSVALG
jgi:hypothetical protein